MTARVIYKYPMEGVSIRVPYGIVRNIAPQQSGDPLPCVWVEHGVADLKKSDSMIEINLVGTGHPFDDGYLADNPNLAPGTFFQTAICLDGRLVLHAFQKPVSATD